MELTKELLFHAARIGDLDILNELIKGKEDLNVEDDNGNSALLLATSSRNLSFVELLIENGWGHKLPECKRRYRTNCSD